MFGSWSDNLEISTKTYVVGTQKHMLKIMDKKIFTILCLSKPVLKAMKEIQN